MFSTLKGYYQAKDLLKHIEGCTTAFTKLSCQFLQFYFVFLFYCTYLNFHINFSNISALYVYRFCVNTVKCTKSWLGLNSYLLKCNSVISTYFKYLIFLCLADWFPVWLECVSDWIFRSVALCQHYRLRVQLPNLHSTWRVWREWHFSKINLQRWPWFCCWHCTFRCKGSMAVLSMLDNFSVSILM